MWLRGVMQEDEVTLCVCAYILSLSLSLSLSHTHTLSLSLSLSLSHTHTHTQVAVLTEAMQRGIFDEGDLQFFSDESLKEAGVERAITRSRMLRRIHDHFKP